VRSFSVDHRSLALHLCALVACSRPPTPGHPLSDSAPASGVPTRACITQSANELDPPKADSITIAGNEVNLCFGVEAERSCWHVDVATKDVAPRPVTSPSPARPVANAEARADGTIKVCGAGGSPCTSFAPPGPTQHPEWVTVSDDLSTVAIPDGATLRVYDVASAKLRATIHGWPDSPMPGDRFLYGPTFVTPDRMIVWYAWTPVSEQGRIFDMSGQQLAVVGKDFSSMDPDKNSWRIHGTEWAISGEDAIVTVDVKHPSVTSTYELSALFALPRPKNDHRLLGVLALAGTAHLLIVVTDENPVTIGVLDRHTNTLEKLEPPRCPPRR
jgi:hypothetical protein